MSKGFKLLSVMLLLLALSGCGREKVVYIPEQQLQEQQLQEQQSKTLKYTITRTLPNGNTEIYRTTSYTTWYTQVKFTDEYGTSYHFINSDIKIESK